MQAEAALGIVRARLPYIDRRALPEAWFSALHVGVEPARVTRRPAPRPLAVAHALARPQPRTQAAAHGAGVSAPPARRSPRTAGTRGGGTPPVAACNRKGARLRLGARERHDYPATRVAVTLEQGGARVQLLVRREGAVLHVVALCSERHVALVRRALAEAAAHLAGRGERVASSVRPFLRVAR